MSITINGNGTITGYTPVADGSITAAKLASGAVTTAAMPAGTIIQIVKGTYTSNSNTLNTSDDTWQDVGCSASITMTNASNKLLITISGRNIHENTQYNGIRILRSTDNTPLREFWGYNQGNGWSSDMMGSMHEDTPGTGTHTYKVQMYTDINQSFNLVNYVGAAANGRNQVHIYVMEVKA